MNAVAVPPKRKTWRRFFNPYVAALLVLLLVGAGWGGWKTFGARKSPRELYNIVNVQRADIQDLVTATGTVQPRDYVDVGVQVSGQLKRLHVDVGSEVKQGDLLAEIDPTVLTATVEARRAGLRNQQAMLTEHRSSLLLAELQAARQKNLMSADATTTDQLQQSEAALRAARAQIDQMKAQIEQTQSQLRADEANLNYARIYAPMSGTVVTVTARQGQTLNANQSAPIILRVADLSTMTVQTQVGEADVSKLRENMEVYFTTLGSQGRRWYGTLRKIEPTPTVTNNVVLYNALFDVANGNRSLMTNMTAQVFFVAASAPDVLLVPVAAVQTQRGSGARRSSDPAAASAVPAAAAGASPASAAAPSASAASAASAVAASGPASAAERQARRERLAAMTPEARQAMRERRPAESRGEKAPAAAPVASVPAPGMGPGDPPISAGFPTAPPPRGPRRGTVKVIDENGVIEERTVELGINNRVQVQVLSGLKEGDQVIAGVKAPQGPGPGGRGANAGGPPVMGMGMPPGAGGRGR